MNFRLTAVFLGLVLALAAGLLILVLFEGDSGTSVAADGLMAPLVSAGVTAKEIDTVEIVRTQPTEGRLVFSKGADGRWTLTHPTTARVEGFAIDNVVRDLFAAKPVADPNLTGNLSVHGLADPTLKVTLRAGADRSQTVNVGNTTIGGDQAITYVSTSAAPGRPLAVRKSDLASLFRPDATDNEAWKLAKWLPDYRVRRILGADIRDPSEVQSVKITAAGKELTLVQTAPGEWGFATPAGYGAADYAGDPAPHPNDAPLTGVRPLLNMLTALQVGGRGDYIEHPGDDLSKYGLTPTDPGVVRVELKTKDGPPEVAFFGKRVEENGKPVLPAKVYARLEGDPAVLMVATDRLDGLRQSVLHPDALRNRDLLSPVRRDRIDAIDLTVGKDTVKLRKVGGKWLLYGGPEPAEAKASQVAALLTALTRPRAATEILAAPNDAAFAGAETRAAVKVWYNGVEAPAKAEGDKPPPEPKLKGTPVELTFGKPEGDAVFVRKAADNAKVDLKAPLTLLGLVTKGRLDLLDPKLKSFGTQQADRLAFNRGKEQYELTKADTPAGGWTFAKPDSRKGKSADPKGVSGLLGLLSGSIAERVVTEKPTPEELKKWGLDPAAPLMMVTVGLKGKDKPGEIVYHFGNETEDKQHVYAQQVGRPVVFTARKATFDRFATDDLRDPTVYRLDPGKVRKLTVKGFTGIFGSPREYVAQKKGAEWVGVRPEDYKPDPAKLNALLAALTAPKAATFVGAGKPEYGVDPALNPDATVFTIESDGQPTATLVLGKPAGDGKVYAASSGVPGEVFTLDAMSLKKLTEKPASLQK
ncbi:MAG TPA: DUF4340 domain-containing protein [Fimbriiglobus sp.]|nr:DUF4340 domain-containing protein [Fimbriiglobus sp.]